MNRKIRLIGVNQFVIQFQTNLFLQAVQPFFESCTRFLDNIVFPASIRQVGIIGLQQSKQTLYRRIELFNQTYKGQQLQRVLRTASDCRESFVRCCEVTG